MKSVASDHKQSIMITVGKYQAYLNLSMYEKDFLSPFHGPIPKGTWSFMTTYPKRNDPEPERVKNAFGQVAHAFYGCEADAKSAVAWLLRVLEADSDGWQDGYGGMPGAYIGKRRKG